MERKLLNCDPKAKIALNERSIDWAVHTSFSLLFTFFFMWGLTYCGFGRLYISRSAFSPTAAAGTEVREMVKATLETWSLVYHQW